MDSITVLTTGVGAPGIKGTLYSLKENFDKRLIRVIGTDIKEEVIGKYLCDAFYKISRPSKEYLEQVRMICEQEEVDVLLPQNTLELDILARNKNLFLKNGTSIAVSNAPSIALANDKHRLMEVAKAIGVPTPECYLVEDSISLLEYASLMGWPSEPVVVKPPVSNGMRGVRIIDESIDLKKNFYSEKPTTLFIKMQQLIDVLGSDFPPLLVMRYLPNSEYSVDVLKTDKQAIIPRRRDVIHSGITFEGIVEKNDEIINYSRMLSDACGLDYAFGFQFKLDCNNVPTLLESNPRVQGTMVLSTMAGVNIIYGAVKMALHEDVPEFTVDWGARILRYWGGLGIINGAASVQL